MTITATQKAHLNKMNRAAKDVSLGNIVDKINTVTGSAVVVTSAQASASVVIINTGSTGLIGQVVHVRRSGSTVIVPSTLGTSGSTFANINVQNTGSYLIVTTSPSASCVPLAQGDILSWIAF
jgi:hypothetical protein